MSYLAALFLSLVSVCLVAAAEDGVCVDPDKIKDVLENDKSEKMYKEILSTCKKQEIMQESDVKCIETQYFEKFTPAFVKEDIAKLVTNPAKKEELETLVDECYKKGKELYLRCQIKGVIRICPDAKEGMELTKKELKYD